MERRNRRQRANERRRKIKTYELESELGSKDPSELSSEDSNPSLDNHNYEAQVPQPQNMRNQIEINVESLNTNANAQHLTVGRRELVNTLYRAAIRGDWKAAETAMSLDRNITFIEITGRGENVLHIAASAKQTAFVRKLVEFLDPTLLELQNKYGYTAFCFAAMSGDVETAKVMYEKNTTLPTIRSGIRMTPLEIAASLGKKEMVEYLYGITPLTEFEAEEYMNILVGIIGNDMYDMALNVLNATRMVTSPTESIAKALQVLVRKPLQGPGFLWWERPVSIIATIPHIPYFRRIFSSLQMRRQASVLVEGLWQQILTLPDSDIFKLIEETQIFHYAAEIGNVEFLTLIAQSYPDLLWKFNLNNHSIFHVAVIHRQEKVFKLIYSIGAAKDLITLYKDVNGNNILHLAGKLAPNNRLKIVSGAALQMQRELRWFKDVEKIVPYSYLVSHNTDGFTPRELFQREHTALMAEGEMWMKETVSFCLVVATLIATVAFAAAITIPGGNNQETGAPIFLNDGWFTVFVASDAVAMFSSTASIVMLLSILTSPYVEYDFLYSLPTKLMFGLIFLLASIVCMVLTFSAVFFSIYKEEKQGPLRGLVAGLAWLPIIIYPVLNYKFWNSIFYSIGWLAELILFQPNKHRELMY